jgi:ubiquinone/menaquinone biosynthesis C-methylase UbiE/class 3 adenylate cyclase
MSGHGRPSHRRLSKGKTYADACFLAIDIVGHSELLRTRPHVEADHLLDLFERWVGEMLDRAMAEHRCQYGRFWGWQGDGGICVLHDRHQGKALRATVSYAKHLLDGLDSLNDLAQGEGFRARLAVRIAAHIGHLTTKTTSHFGAIHSAALNLTKHLGSTVPSNKFAVTGDLFAKLDGELQDLFVAASPPRLEGQDVYIYSPLWDAEDGVAQWRGCQLDVFCARHKATPYMYDDMKRSRRVVFVGVSHTKLVDYLGEVVAEAQVAEERLPWESMLVCFASEESGTTWGRWEKYDFRQALLTTRRRLIEFFGAPELLRVAPSFREAVLCQTDLPSFVGMCACTYASQTEDEPSVIYVNQYLPLPHQDLKEAVTRRVAPVGAARQALFRVYVAALEEVRRRSKRIGEVEQNHWNQSADEWDSFLEAFPTYEDSMRELVRFAGLRLSHRVLDVGCSTGRTSRLIADKVDPHRGGGLSVLDESPAMIEKARKALRRYRFVEYYVARTLESVECILPARHFSKLVFHFSFPLIVPRDGTAQEALRRWVRFLARGGEIVVAIHNSFLEVDMPPEWGGWQDSLRAEVERGITELGKRPLPQATKWTVDEIDDMCQRTGLRRVSRLVLAFPRTMEDRFRMWKTPAVRASLFPADVDRVDQDRILEAAREACGACETAPTLVTYLRYKLVTPPSATRPGRKRET